MDKKTTPNEVQNHSDADYRLQVIAPIISLNKDDATYKSRKISLIRQVALDNGISERSVIRWIRNYETHGIEGLQSNYPLFRTKKRLYIRFEELMDEAVAMRLQSHQISVNEIIACLEGRHPNIKGILKRSTVQRHLCSRGVSRAVLRLKSDSGGKDFFGRYRKAHVLEQIQGDFKEPPRNCIVDDRGLPVKVYIQLWVDNCSRMILTHKVALHQTQEVALESFRQLIEQYGVPDSILTDQGSAYRGAAFSHCTATLGISHKRSKPYTPQSKGMNERVNGTMENILRPVRLLKDLKFEKFVALFDEWVREYNHKPHSALTVTDKYGRRQMMSPAEAFSKDQRRVRVATPELIDYAFKIKEKRKVSKDGTLSYKGRLYRIPNALCKPGVRANIIYTTTSGQLELAVRNSVQEISNGMPEFRFYPLYEMEIKADVDFSERSAVDEHSSVYAKHATDIPAELERLARQIAKADGSYTSEEEFKANLTDSLLYRAQESSAQSEADSLYARNIPNTEEK